MRDHSHTRHLKYFTDKNLDQICQSTVLTIYLDPFVSIKET